MAFLRCPECGRNVSSRASACPNCRWPVEVELWKDEGEVRMVRGGPGARARFKPLFDCPDCGGKVSRKALSCPRCGRQFKDPKPQEGIFMKSLNVGCAVFLVIWALLAWYLFIS